MSAVSSDDDNRSPTGLSILFQKSLKVSDEGEPEPMDWEDLNQNDEDIIPMDEEVESGSSKEPSAPISSPIETNITGFRRFLLPISIVVFLALGIYLELRSPELCHKTGVFPSIDSFGVDIHESMIGQLRPIRSILKEIEQFNSTKQITEQSIVVKMLNGSHGVGKSMFFKLLDAYYPQLKVNGIDFQEILMNRKSTANVRLNPCSFKSETNVLPSRIVVVDHANICGEEQAQEDWELVKRIFDYYRTVKERLLVFFKLRGAEMLFGAEVRLCFLQIFLYLPWTTNAGIIQFNEVTRSDVLRLVKKLVVPDIYESTAEYVCSILNLSCDGKSEDKCNRIVSESGYRRIPFLCKYHHDVMAST
ncbi:hypothetical protein ACOME3_006303 [Neoechinorhynchus agilis]